MQKFLTSSAWVEITKAAQLAAAPSFAASAYFGEYGDKLLPLQKDSILVVDATKGNVQSGVVCPASLIKLNEKGVRIFTASNLHAKTYVFGNNTFVGSCNASRRSAQLLIETCIWTDNKNISDAARNFISSIALNELSSKELHDLQKIYIPPRVKGSINPLEKMTLVIDLMQEQGGRRASQVQPPKAVWEEYFKMPWLIPTNKKLKLRNVRSGEYYERPVVIHDHNMTVELSGAQLPRPAILVLKKVGKYSFEYSIYRPLDKQFAVYDTLLSTIENSLRSGARRWFAI